MKTAERQHHAFSPSKLAYLEACSCYESRDEANPAAEAGTRKHTAVERATDDLTLSDDDAGHVAFCQDFVEGRRQHMLVRGVPVEELSEVYLPIDDDTRAVPVWSAAGGWKAQDVRGTTAGYIDKALVQGARAELYDYKFGRWPVDPPSTNLQIWAYVLGLFRHRPAVQLIRAAIIQPTHKPEVQTYIFSRKAIPGMLLRVLQVVARKQRANTAQNFEAAVPSYPTCVFCARLGECPAAAKVVAQVGSKFYPLDIPADITPSAIHNPKDTSLGLRLATVVKVWAEAFRARISDRIMRGDAELPEGYELRTQSRRALVDAEAFRAVALRYLTADEYAATLEPTFGAIENAINTKAPRGSKKATLDDFCQALVDAKAVDPGQPFSFLKAIPDRQTKTQTP